MSRAERIVVVAPHPDDETLGCGATVARHVKDGHLVTVVWLTSGEAGVPGVDADTAVELRQGEARAAVAELGASDGEFLGLPDGGLDDHHDDGVAALAAVLAGHRPNVVYTPHPGDVHPDHRAAAHITIDAMRAAALTGALLLGYEVWSPVTWPDVTYDLDDFVAAKLAALSHHRSQLDQVDYEQLTLGLGSYRGALVGCDHAEAFVTIDWEEKP